MKRKVELVEEISKGGPEMELIPKVHDIDFSSIGLDKLAIDLVEFNHSFYQEAFRDIQLSPATKRLLSLRLVAFIDLHNEDKVNIPLMQAVASRYVSLIFTDRVEDVHPEVDVLNYDV